MKEKTFLVLIIISLLAINGFALLRINKFKQKAMTERAMRYNDEKEKDELITYKVNFTANILNSNLQLDNIIIKDSLSKIIPLKEIFNSKQKQILVFRFSQLNCESCVNSSIQILRKWVDSIGVKNVLFLGNHRNNKVFRKTIPLYSIQGMKVYNGPAINIPAEELGYPYYFVLDSSLQISNVFVPDKATPSITNKYLEYIKKKFSLNLDM